MTEINATIATHNERARCAQLVVNYFMDCGAEETEAMTHPLVAAILRPPKDEVEQARQARS